MLEFRLKSLEIYQEHVCARLGPVHRGPWTWTTSSLTSSPIPTRKATGKACPTTSRTRSTVWAFHEAERAYLAGVGAQYDSELVYHNMQDTASKMGIVYSGIEEALHDPKWEPLIREKFMTLIPPTDHKFAALHGAVWSGGSFVYVPKDTKLDFPLQSYFRLNAKGAGQFEHTLIIVEDGADLHFIEGCSAPKYNVANLHAGAVELFVGKNAHLRYSTIENWSKNMYNLNTKRSVCDEGGSIEWVSGQLRQPCRLPVPHVHPCRPQVHVHVHGHHVRRHRARTSTPAARWCSPHRRPRAPRSRRSPSRRAAACPRSARSVVATREGRELRAQRVSCQIAHARRPTAAPTPFPAMDIRCKHVDVGPRGHHRPHRLMTPCSTL